MTRRTAFLKVPYVALDACTRRPRAIAVNAGQLIKRGPRVLTSTLSVLGGKR